jgi:hypothetical protein
MAHANSYKERFPTHRWIRFGFIAWAIVSTLWLVDSYRTQGVDRALLTDGVHMRVQDSAESRFSL